MRSTTQIKGKSGGNNSTAQPRIMSKWKKTISNKTTLKTYQKENINSKNLMAILNVLWKFLIEMKEKHIDLFARFAIGRNDTSILLLEIA